jgi:hypothetical protein
MFGQLEAWEGPYRYTYRAHELTKLIKNYTYLFHSTSTMYKISSLNS